MKKEDVIEGLLKRIEWMVKNGCSSEEITQTVILIIRTAQKFFDEEQRDRFYKSLADELERNEETEHRTKG